MTPNPNPSPVCLACDDTKVVSQGGHDTGCNACYLSPQTLPAPGEVERKQYSHEERVSGLACTLAAIAKEAEEEHGEWTWREIATAAMNILWCKPGQSLATVAAANDEAFARGVEAAAKIADAYLTAEPDGDHQKHGRTLAAAIRLLSQGGKA